MKNRREFLKDMAKAAIALPMIPAAAHGMLSGETEVQEEQTVKPKPSMLVSVTALQPDVEGPIEFAGETWNLPEDSGKVYEVETVEAPPDYFLPQGAEEFSYSFFSYPSYIYLTYNTIGCSQIADTGDEAIEAMRHGPNARVANGIVYRWWPAGEKERDNE